MITTLSQFQTNYDVKDGEVASASVLSRPSDRLKTELNMVNANVEILLGNYDLLQDWPSGSPYEAGTIVKHVSKFWKSLVDNNSVEPSTDVTKWEDISDLINALLALKTSGDLTSSIEILEFNTFSSFPVTGTIAKIYIATDIALAKYHNSIKCLCMKPILLYPLVCPGKYM